MKKSSSDFIFRLIKSLTKSEKRYFKIYSNRFTYNDKQKYMDLFDAIDKQKEYDEEALKKKFEGEKFLKHFPTVKTRLKDMVLESVGQMNIQKSESGKFRTQIRSIELLYAKGLFEDGFALLSKVEKQLRKEEHWLLLLELANLKAFYQNQLKHFKLNKSENASSIRRFAINSLVLLTDINELNEKLMQIQNQYIFVTETHLQNKVLDLQSQLYKKLPLIGNQEYHTKIKALEGLCAGDYTLQNWKNFQKNTKTLLDVYQQNKDFFKKHLHNYIVRSYNYTIGCNSSKNFSETLRIIEKWKEIEKKYPLREIDQSIVFTYSTINQLIVYSNMNLPKAIKYAKEIEPKLQNLRKKHFVASMIDIYNQLSSLFFIDKAYIKTIYWSEKQRDYFINNKKYKHTASLAYLKIILAHFELKNTLHLEHLISQIVRVLKKHSLYKNIHTIFFRHLKRIISIEIYSSEKEQKLWQLFYDKINHSNIKEEKKVLPYFIDSWLNSKIQNRPLKDILIESYEKENRNSTP